VILQHIRTYVPKRRPENVVVSTDVFCIDAIFRNESEDSAHPSKGVSVSLGGAILSLGECLASYIGRTALLTLWNKSAHGDDPLSFLQIDQIIANDAGWACHAIEPEVKLDRLSQTCTITWPQPSNVASVYSFRALHKTWAGLAVLTKEFRFDLEKTTNGFLPPRFDDGHQHHFGQALLENRTAHQFDSLKQHSPRSHRGSNCSDLIKYLIPEQDSIYELSADSGAPNACSILVDTNTGPKLVFSDVFNSQPEFNQSSEDGHVESTTTHAAVANVGPSRFSFDGGRSHARKRSWRRFRDWLRCSRCTFLSDRQFRRS
jgi:hypothetical protein